MPVGVLVTSEHVCLHHADLVVCYFVFCFFTKTTEDHNVNVRQRAESRGSLKSVQITQGAVSQFTATAELTIFPASSEES